MQFLCRRAWRFDFQRKERDMALLVPLCAVLILLSPSMGDLFLHSPRGSNNRLNERSANRNNANRLFDSQVR